MGNHETKSIIVTGATSMIGAAIVQEALERGGRVAAVVRKNSPQNANLHSQRNHPRLEIVESAIEDYGKLQFARPYDAFIHLAWQSTEFTLRNDMRSQAANIAYTADAIHAAARAGCQVFMLAGSQAEYGLVSEKIRGDSPCNPVSGYGIAKYAAGKLALLEAARLGMRACHTRVLSVYGEGMSDKTLLSYLIKTLLAGQSPALTKCEQTWDFMHVRDTARAFMAIVEHGIDGKTYPIGSGLGKPLRSYVETVRDILCPTAELGFGKRAYDPHQTLYLCADIDELCRDTGFHPSIPFEEGIRKTIDWIKSSKRNEQ